MAIAPIVMRAKLALLISTVFGVKKDVLEPVVELDAHRQEFRLVELVNRSNLFDDPLSLLGTPPGFGDASERVNAV